MRDPVGTQTMNQGCGGKWNASSWGTDPGGMKTGMPEERVVGLDPNMNVD